MHVQWQLQMTWGVTSDKSSYYHRVLIGENIFCKKKKKTISYHNYKMLATNMCFYLRCFKMDELSDKLKALEEELKDEHNKVIQVKYTIKVT